MATSKVTVGDDVGLSCTLKRANLAIAIDASAVIRVSVSNTRKDKSYTGPITLSNVDANHALEDGVVWVVIPKANTTKMIPGDAVLEIEVDDSTQIPGNQNDTWNLPVTVVASTLS